MRLTRCLLTKTAAKESVEVGRAGAKKGNKVGVHQWFRYLPKAMITLLFKQARTLWRTKNIGWGGEESSGGLSPLKRVNKTSTTNEFRTKIPRDPRGDFLNKKVL